MASSTTETGGAPRQTAPASGEGLRLGRTDRACVHPRARGFYALPAWGILVIRTGEKTVIPPTGARTTARRAKRKRDNFEVERDRRLQRVTLCIPPRGRSPR